jgi:hypothetical protein
MRRACPFLRYLPYGRPRVVSWWLLSWWRSAKKSRRSRSLVQIPVSPTISQVKFWPFATLNRSAMSGSRIPQERGLIHAGS